MKKILFIIMGLLMLLCGFIILCEFIPGLSDKIGNIRGAQQTEITVTSNNPEETISASEETTVPSEETPEETTASSEETPEETISALEETTAPSDETPEESVAPSEETPEENSQNGLLNPTGTGYVQPERGKMQIPQQVAGKGGYEPVKGDETQLKGTEEKKLEESLSTGATGDGLTFDSVFYPYYSMLDEKGQHLYRQIYANANTANPTFAPIEKVGSAGLKNAFQAVFNDHPELFWMDPGYSCKIGRDGICRELTLKFNRLSKNLESEKAVFQENAKKILDQVSGLQDEYSKELAVHNAILEKDSYNLSAELNQSAYSAIVNGQTVCAGYARAFQYLMLELRIPCYYCTGYAGESHAWNVIGLADGYYNVDATWDDTDGRKYDFFNKTDYDYEKTHIRQDLSVYLPQCNGTLYRNREKDESGLKSLEEAGVKEDQVFYSLAGYYENCANQMIAKGKTNYTFVNVLDGEALYQQWNQAFQNNGFQSAYLDNVVSKLGAGRCNMTLEAEKIQGGRYLITHKVELY